MLTKIAQEAQALSRQVFASLPYQVRIAHVLRTILGYVTEDLPGLGLAALQAMYKAGIQGPVGRSGILVEDAGLNLNSSAAYKAALEIGKRIHAGSNVKNFSPSYIEEGLMSLEFSLLEGKIALDPKYNVNQAISYLARALHSRVSNTRKTDENRGRLQDYLVPVYEEMLMGKGRRNRFTPAVWDAMIHLVSKNPSYVDDTGKNRVVAWLENEAQGIPLTTTARELGLSEGAFRTWIKKRMPLIQKDLKNIIDKLKQASTV